MPMIDIYATAGTFADVHALAREAAATVMRVEAVPEIPLFTQNTAGFVHELPALSDVEGSGNHVRVQVLTNAGALSREQQLAVVAQLTELVATAAGDPTLTARTWVTLTEAVAGGWGIGGHAHTNDEIVAAARAQIGALQAGA